MTMRKNEHIFGTLSLAVVLLGGLGGSVSIQADQNERIENEFLKSLNEASEIVSRERLNIEKVPSTVTVVRRNTIVASGAATLLDVLKLVPGIDVAMSASGKRQIVVRGMRDKYRDKIKLLINGVDVTNNLYSNQFYYYDFPASLIKRVEVTKTPDAILYGSNAFLGVINVITLDEGNANQLFVESSDEKRHVVSLFQNIKAAGGDLRIDAHDIYMHPSIESPPVMARMKAGNTTLLRGSMPAHTLERGMGAGISYDQDRWHLKYRLQRYVKGSFFGVADIPPLRHDRDVTMTHHTFEAAYEKWLRPDLKWRTAFDLTHYTWDGDYRAFPDLNHVNDPKKDRIMGAYIREISSGVTSYLKYAFASHDLTLQAEGHYAKPDKMYYLYHRADEPAKPLTGEDNILKEGVDRKNFALAMEDLYSFSDRVSFIYGLRYDYYNDFNGHWSWKAGTVVSPGGQDTFKLLYNHAFRAPSWAELYANAATEFKGYPRLNPESIDMLELVWLHRFSGKDILKANLFYGRLDDPIVKGIQMYENGSAEMLRGVELSYRSGLTGSGEWGASLSYHHDDIPQLTTIESNSREWLVRTHLSWYLLPQLQSYTWMEYGSPIDMGSHLPDIDDYWLVNETMTWRKGDWRFQAGVRNLFDQRIDYPVQPVRLGDVTLYPQGLAVPAMGREWFARVTYRW